MLPVNCNVRTLKNVILQHCTMDAPSFYMSPQITPVWMGMEQSGQPGIVRKQRNLHCDAHVVAQNKRRRHSKQMHVTAVLSYRTCVDFDDVRSSNVEKCTVLGCHDHHLNTDRKRLFFFFKISVNFKAQKSWRKEFDSVCFQRCCTVAISIIT